MSNYIKEIMNYPCLSDFETFKLLKKTKDGDLRAREKLIVHNLSKVVKIALQFQEDFNESVDELINIGCFGLINAIDTFHNQDTFSFNSYLLNGIKEAFLNYLKYLNNIDGNLYLTFDELNDKSISYNDDLILCTQVSIEEEIINNLEHKDVNDLFMSLANKGPNIVDRPKNLILK